MRLSPVLKLLHRSQMVLTHSFQVNCAYVISNKTTACISSLRTSKFPPRSQYRYTCRTPHLSLAYMSTYSYTYHQVHTRASSLYHSLATSELNKTLPPQLPDQKQALLLYSQRLRGMRLHEATTSLMGMHRSATLFLSEEVHAVRTFFIAHSHRACHTSRVEA